VNADQMEPCVSGADNPVSEASAVLAMLDPEVQRREILASYRRARGRFGMARLELGARLYLIRENRLWEGLASSWEEFLGAESLNPHAARQYINVARKFVFEMDLTQEVLEVISAAGVTALERAAKMITEDNKDEVIAVLTSLSERDAVQAILDIGAESKKTESSPSMMRVLKLLREYHELPPDLQQEFRGRLSGYQASRTGKSD
jgi:hypothetical protein